MTRTTSKPLAVVCICLTALLIAVLGPSAAQAGSGGVGIGGGGGNGGSGGKTVPGKKAKLVKGKAIAPRSAPASVKRAIAAGNAIRHKPYRLGGGHGKWKDTAYDCSGAASYVLGKYGARKLASPMPSGGFYKYGRAGAGKWITVYANGGHMYLKVAGLRFDTSNNHKRKSGPRWTTDVKGGKVNGPFHTRHPAGL